MKVLIGACLIALFAFAALPKDAPLPKCLPCGKKPGK